jgi:hypothetical protein
MTFTGTVVEGAESMDGGAPEGATVIDVVGVVSLGNHVNARVTVVTG